MATFNIIKGNNGLSTEDFFILKGNTATRGHPLQLRVKYTRLDIAKNFFSNRVVNVWNDLPHELLDIVNPDTFKAKIPIEVIRRHCKIYQ